MKKNRMKKMIESQSALLLLYSDDLDAAGEVVDGFANQLDEARRTEQMLIDIIDKQRLELQYASDQMSKILDIVIPF